MAEIGRRYATIVVLKLDYIVLEGDLVATSGEVLALETLDYIYCFCFAATSKVEEVPKLWYELPHLQLLVCCYFFIKTVHNGMSALLWPHKINEIQDILCLLPSRIYSPFY